MADVYISYSHSDIELANRLADALRLSGLTVWLESHLAGNDVSSPSMMHELKSASAVVVLWSARSVKSEWVQREVAEAPDHVVSVYIEPVEPQIHGGMHLAVDLAEWTGSVDDPQLQRLVRGIRTRLELDELDPFSSFPSISTGHAPSVPPPTSIPPPDDELDPLILLDPPRRTPPASSVPAPTSIPPSDYDPLADVVPDPDLDTSKATKNPVSPQRTMVAVNYPHVIGTAWQTIRAYLFPKVAETEIADDARRLRDSAEAQHTSGQVNVSQIQLGTLITVIIDLPDIECHPRQRRFIWRGRWKKTDFMMRHLGTRGRQEGTISWFAGIVCIAQLPLNVQLTDEYEKRPSLTTVTAPGYESVFVSYSTKDSKVVDWLETTYTALGMTYLRDVKALRSGEAWDKQLLKLIERADLFQLCWSANAKQSSYVSDEWRFALGLNKPSFIRPCYWEHPMPEPPPELQRLHFARLKLNWLTRTWFRLRARFG